MLRKIMIILLWDIPAADKEKLIKELVNYEANQ